MGVDTLLLAYFSVIYQERNTTNVNEIASKNEDKKVEITVF